jgi:hypothetical protein
MTSPSWTRVIGILLAIVAASVIGMVVLYAWFALSAPRM